MHQPIYISLLALKHLTLKSLPVHLYKRQQSLEALINIVLLRAWSLRSDSWLHRGLP